MKTMLVKSAALAVVLLTPLACLAQTEKLVPFDAATGLWGDTANWVSYASFPIIPEGRFNDTAVIDNGGRAQVNQPFTGSTSLQGPGQILLIDGTIEIQNNGRLEVFLQSVTASEANGSIDIQGNLEIQGGGQLFDRAATTAVPSSLTFGAASNYSIDYTASTTAPITVSGPASLNGTLNLDFSAISAAGTHPILSASSVTGSFANVNATGLNAAQTLVVSSAAGVVEANVYNVPTLTIDRDTGQATITNSHGTPLNLDGFSISSPLGALDASAFSGLARSGWDPAGVGSANIVGQAYEGPNASSPSDALPAGTPFMVGGNDFWTLPEPTSFLEPTEELIFEVTDEAYGSSPVKGVVNYVGTKTVNNNIVLYVDPSGNAAMLNESDFGQDVEIYQIKSSGSPLQTDTWDPLASQSLGDVIWDVSSQSGASTLLEVTEDNSSLFDRFTRFDIGQILDPGYSQSGITFEFLIAGDNKMTTGEVLFVSTLPDPDTPSSLGDFNNDNIVDAADYAVWRNGLGTTYTQADYDEWRENYGNDYSAAIAQAGTATPEPAGLGLLSAVLALAASCRRSQRG